MNKINFGGMNVKNVVNTIKAGQRGVCVVSFVSMDKKLRGKEIDCGLKWGFTVMGFKWFFVWEM